MSETSQTPYRVLARKYRPQHFDELRGQDALVRTLKNAITSGRLAQAYMLTGVRGVGKTTTARIIARAINYTGPDGKAGPTAGRTDDCAIATAIANGQCPDVIEMDAASHTGVDDMRDIIDGVRYAPTMARYKVYIIDEVHMLSKSAFNALLKTLEEPPEHAKFIFATTEIRKVPMTILSRCQRFDLRRFDDVELKDHLANICKWENLNAEDDALMMIARAGAGSARDGISILDQAIALGDGTVTADLVSNMLGLVDQTRITQLLNAALSGNIPEGLSLLADLNKLGADALVVIEDLLGLTHQLIKARVTGNSDALLPAARDLLTTQNLGTLSRAWQILLRSVQDIHQAPDPFAAAEMAIIRLGYAATLPDPSKLAKQLSDGTLMSSTAAPIIERANAAARAPEMATVKTSNGDIEHAPVAPLTAITTIGSIVELLESTGHMMIAANVARCARPVKIEPGRIEFTPTDGAPPKLAADLMAAMLAATGDRWVVAVTKGSGAETVAEQRDRLERERLEKIAADPLISAVILAFPGTTIEKID